MDQQTNHEPIHLAQPQNIAWLVVIVSFGLFCMLCAASTFGAYWFFFESTTPLNVRLTVSRGAVTIVLPDGSSTVMNDPSQNPKLIPLNSVLQITDSASQGYLTFEDGYARQNVAILFVLPNSSLRLVDASRPRFEWSQRGYVMRFNGAAGHFAVTQYSGLDRSSLVNLQGAGGALRISDSGMYRVDMVDEFTRLYVESGRALLASADGTWRQIDAGNQGTLTKEQGEPKIVPYPLTNLIVENIRAMENPPTTISSLGALDVERISSLPLGWGCTNQAAVDRNEPEGNWARALLDGSLVLHITRGEPTSKLTSHAETSCEFYFTKDKTDGIGQDLKPFKSLSLRLKMKIQFQDVSTCGIQGSECPVMLELEYLPADSKDGTTQVWRQGFYALRPAYDTSVRTCDTYPHDHEQISPNAWYVYDSGDLLAQFSDTKKPVSIVKVRVYSSGHQFDVALADVGVYGER